MVKKREVAVIPAGTAVALPEDMVTKLASTRQTPGRNPQRQDTARGAAVCNNNRANDSMDVIIRVMFENDNTTPGVQPRQDGVAKCFAFSQAGGAWSRMNATQQQADTCVTARTAWWTLAEGRPAAQSVQGNTPVELHAVSAPTTRAR